MKKVAIMTWYSYNNYGSVLQAYALSSAVKNLGYDSFMINYDPNEKIKYNYSFSNDFKKNVKRVRNYINNKLLYPKVISNSSKFDEFRDEYLNLTSPCITSSDLYNLNSEYDCFICGSDQIWAPTVFDSKYFLDFVSSEHKIAYAPSIGLPKIENSYVKEQMSKLISDFKYLSTREENGRRIIKEICDKDAKVVIDPTLLLSNNDWVKRFNLIRNDDKYILCYFLTENSKSFKVAKEISKRLGIPIKFIPVNNKDFYRDDVIKEPIGPSDFISLIYNASLVLTDSFHGTIFSINFNVPFVTFKRFKDNNLSQNSRIYNILKKVGLENRIYDDEFDFENLLDIDFNNSNSVLENEREDCLSFLNSSLKGATKSGNCKEEITNVCTGCGMCAAVCPKKCITIEKNKYGFFERKIDKEKCINCHLCEQVCCQNSTSAKSIDDSKVYSAFSSDENVVINSSSGGLAYAISLNALENSSSVIGCAYDLDDNIAKHIVVDNVKDLDKLRGSKYIQSYTVDAFQKIKKMDGGVIVGTPCQIASVSMYLSKIGKRDNFILVDLICHGVPSYNLWNKYLKENNHDHIKNISFRNKKYGWRTKCLYISDNKDYYGKENQDMFLKYFTVGNSYNRSCYECNFRIKSCADIRLGDFWGSKFKDNQKGVNIVLAFTENGNKLLNDLKNAGKINLDVQMVNDYSSNQQVKNVCEPLYYYDLMNDISSDNLSLVDIDKKYIDYFVKKNKRLNRVIKIVSFFRKGR